MSALPECGGLNHLGSSGVTHELGDALLLQGGHRHAPGICEALCDAFAAELLMPRAELSGVRDAGWIAGRYDVSLAAARRRVRELSPAALPGDEGAVDRLRAAG